jgi:3-deoxy-D-arabino-heptulosonate 7-phosphate (DAHP) synthase
MYEETGVVQKPALDQSANTNTGLVMSRNLLFCSLVWTNAILDRIV